ncbi:porin family protein [Hymenobacter sp. AT01-02]|uniref:porin family protein n=1 Tax=Hymenobacter sp. AT01-02 TaxID=1571877 RepID=UPI0005F11B45|nr:porin family protein [Hymenobacter sp. AT01-02]
MACWAQTGVQVGAKAGLNLAVLDGSINQDTKFKPGFHFGGVLRWRPAAHFALQPELVYSQQGSNNEIPVGPGVALENKTKLSYLNIPVLAKIYLGNVVNLQVGPQFGLLLAAQREGQVGYYASSNGSGFRTEDVDVKDNYKGDVALCAGLGADLKNGLLLSARLNYGVTDINNDESQKQLRDYLDIGGLHNRVVEFSVGYLFGSK